MNWKVLILYGLILILSGYTVYTNISQSKKISSLASENAGLCADIDAMVIDSTKYINVARAFDVQDNRINGLALQVQEISRFSNGVNAYVKQQIGFNVALDSLKAVKYFPPAPKPDENASTQPGKEQ